MFHSKLSVSLLFVSVVLVFTLLLSGCYSPRAVWSEQKAVQSRDPLPSEDVSIISDLAERLQSGDVEALAGMVGESGLIVAPYAVGAPDQGLTGRALDALVRSHTRRGRRSSNEWR